MAKGGTSILKVLDGRRCCTGRPCLSAARSEGASQGETGQGRRRSWNLRKLRARLVLGRYRGEKACSIGMAWRCNHICSGPAFHHPARIHDADVVREARYDCKIVGHPDEGRAGLVRKT